MRWVTGLLLGVLGFPGGGCQASRCTSRPGGVPELSQVLSSLPSAGALVSDPARFRLQVLVSPVVRDGSGRSALSPMGYRVDAEYFYPASSIKLCAAVAGLQVLEELGRESSAGDLLHAPLEIGPLFEGDPPQRENSDGAEPGKDRVPTAITVGREIRKLALVSDNRAFNRLYDLVGHDDLNRRMHDLGLSSVVLHHRLSESRAIPDMRATAPVWISRAGLPPLAIPQRTGVWDGVNSGPGLTVGQAYLRGDERVERPMDFTRRNGISLVDLQNLLVKLVRPDIATPGRALRLDPVHRAHLVDAMTQYPRESLDPLYPAAEYPDEHSKFLLPGVRRVFPSDEPGQRIEITGKTGRAYGFSVENSWVRNPRNGRSVFVTAVLYTNADGVLNDDVYEYETVADPFFADLGEWVARRWLLDPDPAAAERPGP